MMCVRVYVCRAMEGPRAGISNVEQHVNQLEQRLEDCVANKANSADVPSNTQVSHASLCNFCLSVQLLTMSVCLSVCLQTLLVCVYWHQRFLNQYEIRHRHSTNASQQQRRPTTSHAACASLWHAENKHFSFSLCTDGKPGGTGSEQGASCPARPAGPDAAAPGRWTKSHTICPLAAMLQHMVFSDASNCSCSVQQSSCSDSLWPA